LGYYPTPEDCQISLSFIYEEYFGLRNEGYFVDIGAYDGVRFSNTWGLAKMGWSGLAVEANPETYELLKKNYQAFAPRVQHVRWAAGKRGQGRIAIAGSISTCSQDQFVEFVKNDWMTGSEKFTAVDVHPLNEILDTFKISGGFDVLNLDVEGSEWEVLEDFTIDKWQPKLCIVESHEHHPIKSFGRHASLINDYFEKAGYYKIYCDMVNNIYVRKDFK
jgi:FkbM family methyltransferase